MQQAGPFTRKVLFYVERDLHLPFLEPIHDWMKANSACELAFSAPAYRESYEGQPGIGLPQEQMHRLATKGRLVDDLRSYQPDVIVCADACTHLLGSGKLVFVGHGIISKGTFYTSGPVVRRENLADLICVPGPLHKEILEANVFTPIVVTGFIKSDRMFAHGTPDRAAARQQLGLPSRGEVVLYAPTYNPEMSSLYVLGEQIAQLCDEGLHLLVKLHTMTDRAIKDRFRRLALQHPRLHYCEEIDVTPAMLAADLLITDVSSVMAEFMFLDRPVIVVDNPRLNEFPLYVPDDIEYRVRDTATIRVGSLAELRAAVRRSLDNPLELSLQRRAVADALCFGRDGRAAERCGRAILDLLVQPPRRPEASCCVVLDWPFAPSDSTAEQLEAQLRRDNPEVALQVLHGHQLRQPARSTAWYDDIAALARGDYLLLLHPGERFPEGWINRLILHHRWSGADTVVQPLSCRQDLPRLIGRFLPTDISGIDPRRVAAVLFQGLCGFQEPAAECTDQCLLIQRRQFLRLAMVEQGFLHERLRHLPRVQALDTLAWSEQILPDSRATVAPRPAEPLVSIIIPLYNKVELTARCLETLFQHTPQDRYELVLVDNGSTDRTDELLAVMPPTVRVIRNSANAGFARACNQGAQAAQGDLLLFLNNDTELLPNWLEPLVETIGSDPAIAAVGSKLLFPDGTIQHAGVVVVDNRVNKDPLCGVHLWHGMPADTPDANLQRDFKALTAACLLIRSRDFHEAGGFDEGYWNGYEDVDLCFKLLQRGRRLVYEPRSVLIHHESKSGPERFSRVDANIQRLHGRWLGTIRPDIRINPDTSCEWLDQPSSAGSFG